MVDNALSWLGWIISTAVLPIILTLLTPKISKILSKLSQAFRTSLAKRKLKKLEFLETSFKHDLFELDSMRLLNSYMFWFCLCMFTNVMGLLYIVSNKLEFILRHPEIQDYTFSNVDSGYYIMALGIIVSNTLMLWKGTSALNYNYAIRSWKRNPDRSRSAWLAEITKLDPELAHDRSITASEISGAIVPASTATRPSSD